jgi:very-short-patch-repair endonuclease
VCSRSQLLALGLSDRTIRRVVARGDLERVGSHVLRVPGWPASWAGEVWTAWLEAGEDAVISHRSAAVIHRLDGCRPGPIDVSVPHWRRLSGPSVYRVRSLREEHVELTARGLRVSTIPKTLAELGAVSDADVVERALESALRTGQTSEAQVDQIARQLQGPGRRGPAIALEVLGRRRPGAPATGSDLETCFLQLTRLAGLPDPLRQFELRVGRSTIRLDFAWPPCRLAVETDGAETHATPEALVADLRRQNQIMFGWFILRFSWDDVHLHPDAVCEVLRRAWLVLQSGSVAGRR